MATITNYKLTVADGFDRLSAAVNAAIADGWQPLGGVQVTPTGMLIQAMVQSS